MDCTVYESLKFAGARMAHHEADLYVKVDPLSRRVIREALEEKRLLNQPTLFEATDGSGLWYELPFSYDPFWDKRLRKPVSA
jgi:hypothetical protein